MKLEPAMVWMVDLKVLQKIRALGSPCPQLCAAPTLAGEGTCVQYSETHAFYKEKGVNGHISRRYVHNMFFSTWQRQYVHEINTYHNSTQGVGFYRSWKVTHSAEVAK